MSNFVLNSRPLWHFHHHRVMITNVEDDFKRILQIELHPCVSCIVLFEGLKSNLSQTSLCKLILEIVQKSQPYNPNIFVQTYFLITQEGVVQWLKYCKSTCIYFAVTTMALNNIRLNNKSFLRISIFYRLPFNGSYFFF